MPIETANYISQLDPTNPAAPDLVADTDNHLRMIKQVLKNTFPNISAPVTLTPQQLSSYVPIGVITMWVGIESSLPVGWALCNGQVLARTDGLGSITTPDLRNRFIKGASGDVASVGGSVSLPGSTTASGDHTHSGWTDSQGNHSHGGATQGHALTVGQMPSHTHAVQVAVISGGAGSGLYSPSNNVFMEDRATSSVGSNEAHLHGISLDGNHAHSVGTYGAGNHTHTVYIADGRPPFYSLAFIMKY